jgi:hypothetical protein
LFITLRFIVSLDDGLHSLREIVTAPQMLGFMSKSVKTSLSASNFNSADFMKGGFRSAPAMLQALQSGATDFIRRRILCV